MQARGVNNRASAVISPSAVIPFITFPFRKKPLPEKEICDRFKVNSESIQIMTDCYAKCLISEKLYRETRTIKYFYDGS